MIVQRLFSDQGLKRLDRLAGTRLLCAFDFDGTLAPIVARPEDACLPEEARSRLLALSRFAPLAIITGRAIDDIRPRLGFEPDFLIGNHGMEGVPGREQHGQAHLALCREWRAQLEDMLRQPALEGVQVEDKRYSLSVHYRHTPAQGVAEQILQGVLARLAPAPRIVAGKCVFNLVPQDAMHKGSALEELMRASGAEAAIFVGDDVTDEDVFRLRRQDVMSIRVEEAAGTAADFFLEDQCAILQLLDELSHRLRIARAENWVRAGEN